MTDVLWKEINLFESDLVKKDDKATELGIGLLMCEKFMRELVDEQEMLLCDSIAENDAAATEKKDRYESLLQRILRT